MKITKQGALSALCNMSGSIVLDIETQAEYEMSG
jgi:hypothetical protein